MLITGTPQEGGCVRGSFLYRSRAFMLDVAIIENVSSTPISVDDILGITRRICGCELLPHSRRGQSPTIRLGLWSAR